MAPTPAFSRDPLSEFAERGLTVLETHGTEIALVKQRVDAVEKRDGECRNSQAESWREAFRKMGETDKAVRDLAQSVQLHIEADTRAATREDRQGTRRVQTIVALIGACALVLGSLFSAWSSYQAATMSTKAAAVSAQTAKTVEALQAEDAPRLAAPAKPK
jgi:hypothetical protein